MTKEELAQKVIDYYMSKHGDALFEEVHKRSLHILLYGDIVPYPEDMDVSIKKILESEDD